jgi:hypothetical protein
MVSPSACSCVKSTALNKDISAGRTGIDRIPCSPSILRSPFSGKTRAIRSCQVLPQSITMVLWPERSNYYLLHSNRWKLDLVLPLATIRPSLDDHPTGIGTIVPEPTVSQRVLRICRSHTAVARGLKGGTFGPGQASNAWSTSRWPTAGDDDVVSGV